MKTNQLAYIAKWFTLMGIFFQPLLSLPPGYGICQAFINKYAHPFLFTGLDYGMSS